MRYIVVRKEIINTNKFEVSIRDAYPNAYLEFLTTIQEHHDLDFLEASKEYFKAYGLKWTSRENTDGLKRGTFSGKISFSKSTAEKLGRLSCERTYLYRPNEEQSIYKGLSLGFEIIQCLLLKKKLPEKARSQSSNSYRHGK